MDLHDYKYLCQMRTLFFERCTVQKCTIQTRSYTTSHIEEYLSRLTNRYRLDFVPVPLRLIERNEVLDSDVITIKVGNNQGNGKER